MTQSGHAAKPSMSRFGGRARQYPSRGSWLRPTRCAAVKVKLEWQSPRQLGRLRSPLFRRCVAFAPLLLLIFLVSDQNISARTRIPVDMPPLVLWAWDRGDDLSFIDIRDTAVAYLAATVILRGETVLLTPRHHPLAPPQGTRLIAGAHVEVDRYEPPVVSDAQALAFAATLAALREIRPGEFLQIDFEATSSQRAFFLKAVAALRQRLPDAVLSATAFPGACTNGGR